MFQIMQVTAIINIADCFGWQWCTAAMQCSPRQTAIINRIQCQQQSSCRFSMSFRNVSWLQKTRRQCNKRTSPEPDADGLAEGPRWDHSGENQLEFSDFLMGKPWKASKSNGQMKFRTSFFHIMFLYFSIFVHIFPYVSMFRKYFMDKWAIAIYSSVDTRAFFVGSCDPLVGPSSHDGP